MTLFQISDISGMKAAFVAASDALSATNAQLEKLTSAENELVEELNSRKAKALESLEEIEGIGDEGIWRSLNAAFTDDDLKDRYLNRTEKKKFQPYSSSLIFSFLAKIPLDRDSSSLRRVNSKQSRKNYANSKTFKRTRSKRHSRY